MPERREECLRLLLLPGESRGDGPLVGEGGVVGEFGVAVHRLRSQVNGVGGSGLIGCCGAALFALFMLFAFDGGVGTGLREVGVGGELPEHIDGGLATAGGGRGPFRCWRRAARARGGRLGPATCRGTARRGRGGRRRRGSGRRAEVGGGEFVEQIGGDGVVERPRHLDDLRERRRLAAAMAGELADNFDLFGLFGCGGLIGEGVGVDRGCRLKMARREAERCNWLGRLLRRRFGRRLKAPLSRKRLW